MTATNHVLTGTLIGLAVHNPAIAVTSAFFSHFICDVIPHFGVKREQQNSRPFKILLVFETVLPLIVLAVLVVTQPFNWAWAALCGFMAFVPDALWARSYWYLTHDKEFNPVWIERFLHDIQWFERPIGAFVELAWATAAIILISQFL